MKRAFLVVATLVCVAATIELASWVGLWTLEGWYGLDSSYPMSREQRTILERVVSGAPTYLTLSPSLGWTINPDSTSVDGLYRSNSQGLRASRDYAPAPPPGRIRLAVFGDSFTHGNDVANDETWEAYLEARDERLEVLNFGVGGYGPDQALLRYRQDGSRFRSDIVVIGFSSENIRRTVNTYRPLYDRRAPNPFAKPRFRLDGDRLVLVPNPLPSLQDVERLLQGDHASLARVEAHDHYAVLPELRPLGATATVRLARVLARRLWRDRSIYRRDGVYDRSGDAYRITLRLLEEFDRAARAEGATPIILLYPNATDHRRRLAGQPVTYAPLLADLTARGLPVIDLMGAFERHVLVPDDLLGFIPAHYSARGNRLIADFIHDHLRRTSLR